MPIKSWKEYYKQTGARPPHETLLFALDKFEIERSDNEQPLRAIDLGCGNGRDTVELLRFLAGKSFSVCCGGAVGSSTSTSRHRSGGGLKVVQAIMPRTNKVALSTWKEPRQPMICDSFSTPGFNASDPV